MADETPRSRGKHFRQDVEVDEQAETKAEVNAAEVEAAPEADAATEAAPAPEEEFEPSPEPSTAPEPLKVISAAESDGADADEATSEASSEDEKPAKGRPRKRRIVLVVLLVLVVVLLACVGGAYAWWRHSVEEGRRAMTEAVVERAKEQAGTIEYDGKRWRLNEDIVTVCFIGYDDSADGEYKGGQSDAILVFALNTRTGEAKAINIPRDSMVTVDAYSGDSYAGQTTEQICLQYSYGDGAHRSSELTVNTVSRLLYNVPIDYYFTLNIKGVDSLNDAIGGVTLTAVRDVPEVGIYTGDEVTLMGYTARRYVQFRDISISDGSLDRQARQFQYLNAFVDKVLETAKSDPGKLLELYNVAQDYTYTNLGVDEFTFLADTMLAHGVSGLEVIQLEGEMTRGEVFAEYHLDKDFLRKQVIETFYEVVE